MSYLHIINLYRPEGQTILMFKECYALEKIHGTSSHLTFTYTNTPSGSDWVISFFSGGESQDKFVKLFKAEELLAKIRSIGLPQDKKLTIYGEAYGGKQQGMSATYGKDLKFVAFDVKIGDCWLDVPKAAELVTGFGLEFVDYCKVSTDIAALDAERDKPSTQAVRNGILEPKKREGVVLRPLQEMTLNNGSRVICKHKTAEFSETATPRVVDDPAKLQVLADANKIADEWVVMHRLEHVLQKIPDYSIKDMPKVIAAMLEDVLREAKGEIIESKEVYKAINSKTATLFKTHLKNKSHQPASTDKTLMQVGHGC